MEYGGHSVGQFTVDLKFNPLDTHLITGSSEGMLYIYDIMKSTPVKSYQAHTKVLSALDWHETGGVVSGSHDGSLCYWKI